MGDMRGLTLAHHVLYTRYMITLLLALTISTAEAKLNLFEHNTIALAAMANGIETTTMIKIAKIESNHNRKAKRLNLNGSIDIGMFQINSVHWNSTCKDLDVFSLGGNTECAARLILAAKRHAGKDRNWIGRYHSKTPHLKRAYVAKLALE